MLSKPDAATASLLPAEAEETVDRTLKHKSTVLRKMKQLFKVWSSSMMNLIRITILKKKLLLEIMVNMIVTSLIIKSSS